MSTTTSCPGCGMGVSIPDPPRIGTRCPACHNSTLTINKGRLLCTWHKCPAPTLIDKLGEPNRCLTGPVPGSEV